MGFIMDGLDAEAYDRSYGDRTLVVRIVGYFRPQVRVMLLVAGLIVFNSVADTGLPILLARGIDALSAARTLSTLGWLVGAILASSVLSWTFNFLRQRNTARAVGAVVLKLRLDAFGAVMARDMSFYDEYPSGKIVSRVTSDTEDFSTVVTLVLNLLSQCLLVVLITIALFVIDARLALLALAMAPAIVIVALAFRRIARRTTTRARRALARVNNTVQETISGISIAKNFRQEQQIYDEFRGVNAQSYAVNLRQGLVFTGIFPILSTIAGLGTALVVYFGGLAVLGGAVSPGAWFLFLQAITILWFPLTSIASFWSQFQQGLSASERVFALIDAEPRVVQSGQITVPNIEGAIEFRHVSFRYVTSAPVLTDFNLAIRPRETVALVGHTGAGKSSIIKLIERFYEFQGGHILIDGQDIRSLDLSDFRHHIGIVSQIPFLFSGSVADNIRYAKPDATDKEVEQVAQRIGGGDWLEALSNGLMTQVGEGGKALSMGQRQLVALARLLMQEPAIVILDEATASVDPLTEAQIQEGLDVLLGDRTAILIAHRLTTVRHADRILVVREGAIVEEGTHEVLLKLGGEYASLYNTYFRSQEPDYRPGQGFVAVRTSPEAMESAI